MSIRSTSSNSATITRNSLWYFVDASVATAVMLLASVPVARVLGPQVLGEYIYLVFLTGVAQRLAHLGLPATACKYMAEYLGSGQVDVAHAVYRRTLKQQAVIATAVTALACAAVFLFSEPRLQLVSTIVVLSMWPGMVNTICAQANVAREDLRANIPGSFANFSVYSVMIVLTLVLGWGLTGLACATFSARLVEAVVRYWSVERWLGGIPVANLPIDLRDRMLSFSKGNLLLLVLGLVVWDRSEVVFLKQFSDVREVAFYSLAFSIVHQLLMVPRALSSSIGVTMFAQYGRDSRGLRSLMENGTRYVALLAIPLFFGLAAVAEPLIRLVYGEAYLRVVGVLWVMSVLAIPRALQLHTENVLQATENQTFMVKWLTVCAIANVGINWLLIPPYGAMGAAIGNGVVQTLAVGGLWLRATSVLRVKDPTLGFFLKVLGTGLGVVAVVAPLSRSLTPVAALLLGIPLGCILFGAGLRVAGGLRLEDGLRLRQISLRFPGGPPFVDRALKVLLPPSAQTPPPANIASK